MTDKDEQATDRAKAQKARHEKILAIQADAFARAIECNETFIKHLEWEIGQLHGQIQTLKAKKEKKKKKVL